MGLREINATRTRALIASGAMNLFTERGFEATTMEDVATHVGIGTSTLYRYFPTKETLALATLGDPAQMSADVLARPGAEALEVALGNAVLSFMTRVNEDEEQARQFGVLLETNHRLQARLMEWLGEAHEALVAALAERSGLPADDIHLGAMAWMTIFVLQQIGAAGDGNRSPEQVAADVMRALAQQQVLTPRLAD